MDRQNGSSCHNPTEWRLRGKRQPITANRSLPNADQRRVANEGEAVFEVLIVEAVSAAGLRRYRAKAKTRAAPVTSTSADA